VLALSLVSLEPWILDGFVREDDAFGGDELSLDTERKGAVRVRGAWDVEEDFAWVLGGRELVDGFLADPEAVDLVWLAEGYREGLEVEEAARICGRGRFGKPLLGSVLGFPVRLGLNFFWGGVGSKLSSLRAAGG